MSAKLYSETNQIAPLKRRFSGVHAPPPEHLTNPKTLSNKYSKRTILTPENRGRHQCYMALNWLKNGFRIN